MSVQEMLHQTNAVDAISRELGVDPATAEKGASALLPSILAGFQSPEAAQANALGGGAGAAAGGLGGLGGLMGTIAGLGGGHLLDTATSNEPTHVDKGNEILGSIFGSKDRSREVAATAASQSGVEPSLLKKMLPILAMVVGGYVMKKAQGGGGLGGGLAGGLGGALGGMLGGQMAGGADPQPQPRGQSDPSGILGDLIGAAGSFLGR
jgi:hypothetical protein